MESIPFIKKIIEPAITKSLTILINQVLHVGVFPDKLKIAKVFPIYKKVTKEYLVIIYLSLFCQPFQKYWKESHMINCHLI